MLIQELNSLYSTDSKQNTRIWSIKVEKDNDKISIITSHGLINGLKQIDTQFIQKSKNITCLFKENIVKHVNYGELYSIFILLNNQYEFGL